MPTQCSNTLTAAFHHTLGCFVIDGVRAGRTTARLDHAVDTGWGAIERPLNAASSRPAREPFGHPRVYGAFTGLLHLQPARFAVAGFFIGSRTIPLPRG